MPMTISEYAESRHITKQAVYKALKNNPEFEEKTYTGIVRGKESKYLNDELIGILDQTINLPHEFTEDVKTEMRLFQSEDLRAKESEITELNKQLAAEKDKVIAAMGETHKAMIAAVGSAVSESVSANNEAIKTSIDELKDNQATAVKVATLQKDVDRLQEEVKRLEGEKQELREQIQKLEAELKAEHDKSIMQRIFKKS